MPMPNYEDPWDDKRLIAHLVRGLGLRRTDFRWVTIWEFLQRDELALIEESRSDDVGGKESREVLLGLAQGELERWRRYEANRRRLEPIAEAEETATTAATMKPELSDGAARRAQAVAPSIAHDAAIRNPVRGFRDRILGGRILSDKEARDFVASPAVRLLSIEEFGDGGIPPVHRSYVVDDSVDSLGERHVTVWVVYGRFKGEFKRPLVAESVMRMSVAGEVVEAWPGSPLFELVEIGERLSKNYPWEEDDARRFVLTDQIPDALPLRVHLRTIQDHEGWYRRGLVRLEVEPWVPVGDVAKAYRRAQLAMQPRQDRALDEHSLAVFRWVEDRRTAGDTRSLRALQKEAPPGWRWKQDNGLAMLYGRVHQQLMTPDVRIEETSSERVP